MDPRKKRKYIVLIAVCVVLSAGILIWSNVTKPKFEPPPKSNGLGDLTPNLLTTPAKSQASGNVLVGFRPPDVFPISAEFATKVLELDAFKQLNPYLPSDVTEQLGREDPFKNY